MILLAYILWVALAVYVSRRLMRNVNRSRGAKLAAGWGIGVLFALLPIWDVVVGLPVTIDACRNRAGLQVYEEVSLPLSSVIVDSEIAPIPGCGDCIEVLRRGLAREAQVDLAPRAMTASVDPATWVSKPGPARYSISSRGDPRCNSFFDELERIEPEKRAFWKFEGVPANDETCIAAESIERTNAQYRVTTRRAVEQHGVVTLQVQEAVLSSELDQRRLASIARVSQLSWLYKTFTQGLGAPDCPWDKEFEDGTRSHAITARSLLIRMSTQQRSEGSKP